MINHIYDSYIMGKRTIVEFILLLINFIFTLWGLSTLGYGLYCLVKWIRDPVAAVSVGNHDEIISVRRLLLALHHSSSDSFSDSLPKAWFIYFVIGVGVILFIISCFGYIGTSSRSSCCLLTYFIFLAALFLVEIGIAAFIFLKHNWKEVIPRDKTGRLDSVYRFLNLHWNFIKWAGVALLSLQVLAMILALYLRSVFNETNHFRRLRVSKFNKHFRISGSPSSTAANANLDN